MGLPGQRRSVSRTSRRSLLHSQRSNRRRTRYAASKRHKSPESTRHDEASMHPRKVDRFILRLFVGSSSGVFGGVRVI